MTWSDYNKGYGRLFGGPSFDNTEPSSHFGIFVAHRGVHGNGTDNETRINVGSSHDHWLGGTSNDIGPNTLTGGVWTQSDGIFGNVAYPDSFSNVVDGSTTLFIISQIEVMKSLMVL